MTDIDRRFLSPSWVQSQCWPVLAAVGAGTNEADSDLAFESSIELLNTDYRKGSEPGGSLGTGSLACPLFLLLGTLRLVVNRILGPVNKP